ncbi:MAG: superoxide dismutase, partial [Pseudomonadota bacterium]
MAITLPPLPYAENALEPHISANTLSFHYGKHHQTYVTNLNKMIDGTAHANASLEEIVTNSDGGVFNNAAQVWNHTFYWNSMKPGGGGAPTGDVAKLIDDAFGGYDGFKEAFATAGAGQFGSGWAWLVAKGGKVEIAKTPNAETPLTDKAATPLITMDVWEHAYYLVYQNR